MKKISKNFQRANKKLLLNFCLIVTNRGHSPEDHYHEKFFIIYRFCDDAHCA